MTSIAPMTKPFAFILLLFPAFLTAPLHAEHEGKTQILLLGDSTTEAKIPHMLKPEAPRFETMLEQLLALEPGTPPCQVINSGVSGETIHRLIESKRYERQVSGLPGIDWIFIRYGINDRAKREDFATNFPADFRRLFALLKRDHPQAKIVLMTVIPFSKPEVSAEINAHIKTVAKEENLPLFDIFPRYSGELKHGVNMLNYRRYPVEKVPEKFREFVKRRVVGDRVVVMDNELDGILGHLPGWYGDRHPNLAGYYVIADETAKWLGPKLAAKQAE